MEEGSGHWMAFRQVLQVRGMDACFLPPSTYLTSSKVGKVGCLGKARRRHKCVGDGRRWEERGAFWIDYLFLTYLGSPISYE